MRIKIAGMTSGYVSRLFNKNNYSVPCLSALKSIGVMFRFLFTPHTPLLLNSIARVMPQRFSQVGF